jgi:hypothetical protein
MDPRQILFANEVDVDSEGILEQIAEWMHLHGNVSHLLIPQPVYPDARQAMVKATELFGVRVRSDKTIRSASCHFHSSVHEQREAEEIQRILESHGQAIRLSDESPAHEGHRPDGGSGSGPIVSKGSINGSLDAILDIHRRLSELRVVKLSRIHLQHYDE